MILLTPLLVVNSQSDSVKHSSSIMEYANRLSWLNHKRELARFRFVTDGYSDSLAKYDGLYRAMLVESDVISTSSESTDNFGAEERRVIELLKPLIDIRIIEETGKITVLRDSLLQLLGNWSPSALFHLITSGLLQSSVHYSK